jgi:hypothetical protein
MIYITYAERIESFQMVVTEIFKSGFNIEMASRLQKSTICTSNPDPKMILSPQCIA